MQGGMSMSRIIVGIPKRETGIQIRNLLVRNGFDVAGVCTSGTQILNYADLLGEGIVICSCQLTDMMCGELRADLPKTFQMLVLTTGRYPVEEEESVRTLALPLKVQDLLEQVRQMEEISADDRKKRRQRKGGRNERQNQIISKAKEQLMNQKSMSEEEAHRYLQKYSMESGNSMTETAQMLLKMMEETGTEK
jgi:response regulator NasT